MATSNVDVLIKVASDVRGARQAQQAMGDLRSQATDLASSFRQGIGIGAGIFSFQAIAQSLKTAALATLDYSATIEQQTLAFETLLGSADLAQRRIEQIQEFAAATPFEFPEIVESNRVLQVLTDGVLATEKGLRLVGDAAAANAKPFQDVAMWVGRLYGGLQSGTPVGEATMRLVEMGIIGGELQRELNGLAESGKGVGRAFEIVERVLSENNGAMAKQAESFKGLWSTFKDTLKGIASERTGGLFEGLKRELRAVNELLGGSPSKASIEGGAILDRASNTLDRAKAPQGEPDRQLQITENNQALATATMRLEELRDKKREYDQLWSEIIDATNLGAAGRSRVEDLSRQLVPLTETELEELDRLLSEVAARRSALRRLQSDKGVESAKEFEADRADTVATEQLKESDKEANTWLTKNRVEIERELEARRLALKPAEEQLELLRQKMVQAQEAWSIDLQSATSLAQAEQIRLQRDVELLALTEAIEAAERKVTDEKEKQNKEAEDAIEKASRLRLENAKAAQEMTLSQLALSRARMDGDFSVTEAAKWRERQRMLAQQVESQRAYIEQLRALRNAAPENDRAGYDQTIRGEQIRLDDLQAQGVNEGADPYSLREQMVSEITTLEDQFGTTAQGIARGFSTVIRAGVDSVSGGLQTLIGDTRYWTGQLGTIAGPVMGALTGAISRMFTEWIVARGLAAAKSILFSQKEGAADVAAKTPGAVMSSISSWGVAAVVGLAAVMAAMAAFEQGGEVTGGEQVIRVNEGGLHEYVVNARSTARYKPLIAAINEDRLTPEILMSYVAADSKAASAVQTVPTEVMIPAAAAMRYQPLQSAAQVGDSGQALPNITIPPMSLAAAPNVTNRNNLNLATFDDRLSAEEWLKSQEGENWWMDMASKHTHKLRST